MEGNCRERPRYVTKALEVAVYVYMQVVLCCAGKTSSAALGIPAKQSGLGRLYNSRMWMQGKGCQPARDKDMVGATALLAPK